MNDSILLIQSQDSKNNKMGTGFVIHTDDGGSYVLTCNHVLEAVKKPKIDGYEIDIIVTNELYDLALLYVKGLEEKPFILKECVKETSLEKDVSFIGYRKFKSEEFRQNRRESKILDKGTHKQNDTYFGVWEIIAKENHVILHGYSGSPLILDNQVIAIMTNKEKDNRGFATSIQSLALIWKDMPKDLILQEAITNNPFVGLRAFTEEDSQFFFGRDDEVREIVAKLNKSRFLAVVGDSGSGKSSIVKAKVIPHYLEKNYYVLQLRPANNPYAELNPKLKLHIKERDNETILNACSQLCKNEETRLLIYIDQFEELFTGYENQDSSLNREVFLKMLFYLYNNETSQLRIEILFTVRSDYYPRLEGHTQFIELIEKNREDNKCVIQRMEKEQLEETIYKPLTKALIVHEEEAKTFAYFVVKGMIKSKSNEITLLQIALTQTLKEKSSKDLFEAYQKIGGVSRALQTLASETIKAIDNEDEVKPIFMRLVNFSQEGNHTRRIAQKSEFSDRQWELIQLLSSALDISGKRAIRNVDEKLGRLLKLNEKNQTVELVHEALIIGWDSYANWIKEYKHFKPIHDSVMWKTEEYQNDKQKKGYLLTGIPLVKASDLLDDEYRGFLSVDEVEYIEASQKNKIKEELHEKKINRILKGLVVGLLGLVIVSGYFWYEARESEKKVLKILNYSVVNSLEIVDKGNYLLAQNNFEFILKNFQENDNQEINQIIATSWYGKIKVLEAKGKVEEALIVCNTFLGFFSKKKQLYIQRYLSKVVYTKGRLYQKLGKIDLALLEYERLFNLSESNNDRLINRQIIAAWYSTAYITLKILNNLEDSKKIYLKLIKFPKFSQDKIVLEEKAKSFNSLAWIYLLEGNYEKARINTQKGVDLGTKVKYLDINLAHRYLLQNKEEKAKEIYLKYQNINIVNGILEDFNKFKEENISTNLFEKMQKVLIENCNKRIKKCKILN